VNLDAGEIIALFSLGIASLALWRTEFARVQDLRTGVLKGQTGLRLDLDQLAKTIPQCLQSRQRVAAANGQSGSARVLAEEVAKDLPELTRLRTIARQHPFPVFRGASIASDAVVTLHELQVEVGQLQDKYATAWAEDETQRERIWEGVLAKVQGPTGGRRNPVDSAAGCSAEAILLQSEG
jgi:hypothetical protein